MKIRASFDEYFVCICAYWKSRLLFFAGISDTRNYAYFESSISSRRNTVQKNSMKITQGH